MDRSRPGLPVIVIQGASALLLTESAALAVSSPYTGGWELVAPTASGLMAGAWDAAFATVLVLAGVYLYEFPEHHTSLGLVVVVTSLVSALAGGGFLVGTILGVVGGCWAITFEPDEPDLPIPEPLPLAPEVSPVSDPGTLEPRSPPAELWRPCPRCRQRVNVFEPFCEYCTSPLHP